MALPKKTAKCRCGNKLKVKIKLDDYTRVIDGVAQPQTYTREDYYYSIGSCGYCGSVPTSWDSNTCEITDWDCTMNRVQV